MATISKESAKSTTVATINFAANYFVQKTGPRYRGPVFYWTETLHGKTHRHPCAKLLASIRAILPFGKGGCYGFQPRHSHAVVAAFN